MTTSPAVPAPAVLKHNYYLLLGGWFSIAFTILQISGIWWSIKGIRYMGGPAKLALEQPTRYALLCIGLGIVTALFGLYALSGAGVIGKLPLLRTALIVITVIYLLRGLLLLPQIPFVLKHLDLIRFLVFSVIALCVGLVHLGGVVKLFRQGRPA